MAEISVRGNTLHFQGKNYRCAIGKNGLIAAESKREDDGCTPIGVYPLRECWYRADRLNAPETMLPLHVIKPEDGWCDDPKDARYNRHFKIPSPCKKSGGFEHLWREDHAYDLIVPLGYNDNPVIPGKGSAIFLHVAKEDYRGTEGCVALAREDLLKVLAQVTPESRITIAA